MIDKIYIEYLLLKVQNDNDRKSLSSIISIISPQLLNFATTIIGERSIAQDAVQEAMIGMVKSLHKLKDHRKFHAWIYQLTRNKCHDLIRKNHKYKSNCQLDEAQEVQSPDQNLDDVMDIIGLIKQLPSQQQSVIQLFYYSGFSIHEIASILQKPTGTIKSILFDARQTIKHHFGE